MTRLILAPAALVTLLAGCMNDPVPLNDGDTVPVGEELASPSDGIETEYN
ncbi:hypothetical protein SAMN04488012_108101 [Palleronia salina]|uniref:Lipoprotein-attachment site-containing protein n=1 Tax=Palleronia salina TaxID=313368 RepID=A0A1M6ITB3_9RHOB|nr:hypothetical protein [Palleronia salina]SHJ37691.1 hypothetical protein SAMN04488012_108101 [Palleronia salina]